MKKRVINYSVNTKYCVYVKSTLTKMINFKFVYIIFITKKKEKKRFLFLSHIPLNQMILSFASAAPFREDYFHSPLNYFVDNSYSYLEL